MINDIVISAKVYEISEVSNPSAIQHHTIDTPIIFYIINLVLMARADYLTQKKKNCSTCGAPLYLCWAALKRGSSVVKSV